MESILMYMYLTLAYTAVSVEVIESVPSVCVSVCLSVSTLTTEILHLGKRTLKMYGAGGA